MNNKYFEIYSKRINRFNIIISIFSFIIISCFFRIQILPNSNLSNQLKKAGFREKIVIGARGNISDRNNIELATTINKYDFWINSNNKNDIDLIASLFSNTFDKENEYYMDLLNRNSSYNIIEKNIIDEKAYIILDQIKNIKGLRYTKKTSRFYQYNKFASHAIGYMNDDGMGIIGIEKKLNHLLNGDTIKTSLQKGAKGKFFSQESINMDDIAGADIQLTIDIEFQKILQEELHKAVISTNAKGANGIIVDPYNGEILAIASMPDFNPNTYSEYPQINFNNSVISDTYEPGSTFKILPIALILDDNKYSSNDSIDCENGEYKLSNNKLMHDHEENSFLTIKDILVHSSNIGIVKLSESYDKKTLYKLIKKFGFGSNTKIPLNNEAKGRIRDINDWSKTSKNYISIGQELSITNLQLAMAYSVIANGGDLIKPSIIKKINKNNKIIYSNDKNIVRYNVINKQIADNILSMLKEVVEKGTAQSINLNNYSIAGKTGTAQKFKDGHLNNYIATFASIFPAGDTIKPKYVMIVTIDEPEYGKHWANLSAVPSSREIIKRMLIKNPIFHDQLAIKRVNINNPDKKTLGDHPVIDKNSFPNLRGKTLKEALKITKEISVELRPDGISGVIINQSIMPGSKIREEEETICIVKVKI